MQPLGAVLNRTVLQIKKSMGDFCMRPSRVVCLAVVCLLTMSAAAVDYQCPDIAAILKEYSISSRSSTYLSIFDQYCQQDGEVKSSSVGLDTVVKAFPVKFQMGSTDTTVSNFCKTYASLLSQK